MLMYSTTINNIISKYENRIYDVSILTDTETHQEMVISGGIIYKFTRPSDGKFFRYIFKKDSATLLTNSFLTHNNENIVTNKLNSNGKSNI